MNKLVPRLLRDFDFELAGDISGLGTHWETADYWFVKPVDFPVKIKVRGAKT